MSKRFWYVQRRDDCARCHEAHDVAVFSFEEPLTDSEGIWGGWYECPNRNEPVLVQNANERRSPLRRALQGVIDWCLERP